MLDERVEAAAATEPTRSAGRPWWRSEAAYWALTVGVLTAITTWLYGLHALDGGWILHKPSFD